MVKSIVIFILGVCLSLFALDYRRIRNAAINAHQRSNANTRQIHGEANFDNGLWDRCYSLSSRIAELEQFVEKWKDN